jgi:hypothetical protein
MNKVPPDAKRLPPELYTKGFVDADTARQYAWTNVVAHVGERIQTEDGMYKGQKIYDFEFRCPRCEEEHHIHSTTIEGSHPVRCHCDSTLVFTVTAQ